MTPIRKILFPTDFTPYASGVLTHALFLAEQFDAELHVLHAMVLHDDEPSQVEDRFPNAEEVFARLATIAQSEMADLVRPHHEQPIRIQEATRRGFAAAEVILEYAEEIDADLVVMGTHGRRGPSHLLLGSVAERGVRHASCPVLTLREPSASTPLQPPERILVPIDFSAHSRPLLDAARQLAATYSAKLLLLHVVQDPQAPYLYGQLIAGAFGEHRTEIDRRAFEALEALAGDVDFEAHVTHGHPAQEIVDFARDHDCRMIVIATHGQSALERLLIGSTAERVVRRASCPVWSVRSEADAELPGEAQSSS